MSAQSETQLIPCPDCGARNRVPLEKVREEKYPAMVILAKLGNSIEQAVPAKPR